jgi:hypothetical protein
MEDQKLGLDLDWDAAFEDPSLEEGLQVESDTKAFYLALKRALALASTQGQVEAA